MGNWYWQVFLDDTGGGETYLHWLMSAWGWTLSVSLLALVIALVVGSLVGILRTVPNKTVAFLGEAWTEVFRNIPLLVQ
ncbi:MAG: ABC transporter permease subunit, partial [Burkholderiales bacterium]